jgi:hypothetical protein
MGDVLNTLWIVILIQFFVPVHEQPGERRPSVEFIPAPYTPPPARPAAAQRKA